VLLFRCVIKIVVLSAILSKINFISLFRDKGKVVGGPEQVWQMRHFRAGSITHETQLDFVDFVALFRSFR